MLLLNVPSFCKYVSKNRTMLISHRQLKCNNRRATHIKKELSIFQINFVIWKKYASNSKFIPRLGNLSYRLGDAPEKMCAWLQSNFHYFLTEIMWINNVELDCWFVEQYVLLAYIVCSVSAIFICVFFPYKFINRKKTSVYCKYIVLASCHVVYQRATEGKALVLCHHNLTIKMKDSLERATGRPYIKRK